MDQPPAGWPPDWPDVTDAAVIDALAATPRRLFVPPEHRRDAYEDVPLPIGRGQTISQPYIVALMTQALRLSAESRVLEVGTGSGYQAAVLARITPHVFSVEALPELAAGAAERLRALGAPVQIRVGDGRLGWPEHAPYDGVIVTAAAPEVPPALVLQLAEGGRLVIPVGATLSDQILWLIRRRAAGGLTAEALAGVRFVPLVATEPAVPEDPRWAEVRAALRAAMRG